MISEFGTKHTDIANVLGQFGPSRMSKSPDKSVSEFYFEWHTQIPDIMKPSGPDECTKFADLVLRAMFYLSLNDKFLQQAITDLKVDNPTLKSFLDEAIAAESCRKCFNDIAVSSSNLDSTGGVTISKWDTSFADKKSHQKYQKAKQNVGVSKNSSDSLTKKDSEPKAQSNSKTKY